MQESRHGGKFPYLKPGKADAGESCDLSQPGQQSKFKVRLSYISEPKPKILNWDVKGKQQ